MIVDGTHRDDPAGGQVGFRTSLGIISKQAHRRDYRYGVIWSCGKGRLIWAGQWRYLGQSDRFLRPAGFDKKGAFEFVVSECARRRLAAYLANFLARRRKSRADAHNGKDAEAKKLNKARYNA